MVWGEGGVVTSPSLWNHPSFSLATSLTHLGCFLGSGGCCLGRTLGGLGWTLRSSWSPLSCRKQNTSLKASLEPILASVQISLETTLK